MTVIQSSSELINVVILLGAGVIAVTIFKRLKLGSILGYLAAGLLVGPFGLGLFSDPGAILHIAELGVVMFLFIIGLELQPSHLWNLRRQIFGLGTLQVTLCAALLTGVGIAGGLTPLVAFIAATGFTLTSTAIVMQLLEDSGDRSTRRGQRIISILLLEDLAIVPLLALVAFLAPGEGVNGNSRWIGISIALGSFIVLIVAGKWLLNPLFRILAAARAREVMTAAALLVVLGAALLMEFGGLSMALGAFLAGVMLSKSSFRHQLEADIEPFRGILLGLFFLSVGMSLDLPLVAKDWKLIIAGVAAYMAVKSIGIYIIARLTKSSHADALNRTALMAQGGEFAFVLYSAAAVAGIFDGGTNAIFTAIIIISMAAPPIGLMVLRKLLPKGEQSMDGIEIPDGLKGSVLIIGFGRFGQVVSQSLLARGIDVAIIDTDAEQIRDAANFGFKVYYGDGSHLNVLHACGAAEARVIAVCIDDRATATKIVKLVKSEFPNAQLMVRSFDRRHAIELIGAKVDYQIRETFESAMSFGEATLRVMGLSDKEAAETADDIRKRDAERLDLEIVGGSKAGINRIYGNYPRPLPLTTPKRKAEVLNDGKIV